MSEIRATSIAVTLMTQPHIEGFSARAYPDPLKGWLVATIGYGTTVYPDGAPVRKGDTCTREQAREWMLHHINTRCLPGLRSIPTWPHATDNQKAALISFTYNLGPFFKRKERESITRLCVSPERWADAEFVVTTFLKYRNPGTGVENGLRLRRLLEADLFLTKEK